MTAFIFFLFWLLTRWWIQEATADTIGSGGENLSSQRGSAHPASNAGLDLLDL